MNAKVQKWGNSLAIRIPSTLARDTKLSTGSSVELSVCEGKIVIEPSASPQYSLRSLLKGITPKNLHKEIDTGEAVGREVW